MQGLTSPSYVTSPGGPGSIPFGNRSLLGLSLWLETSSLTLNLGKPQIPEIIRWDKISYLDYLQFYPPHSIVWGPLEGPILLTATPIANSKGGLFLGTELSNWLLDQRKLGALIATDVCLRWAWIGHNHANLSDLHKYWMALHVFCSSGVIQTSLHPSKVISSYQCYKGGGGAG